MERKKKKNRLFTASSIYILHKGTNLGTESTSLRAGISEAVLKDLGLFSWIFVNPKVLLHLQSWEPNGSLKVPGRQLYTLHLEVHLQTYGCCRKEWSGFCELQVLQCESRLTGSFISRGQLPPHQHYLFVRT
jgi:hypothetical protein